MPNYKASRKARYALWEKWGFTRNEARELSKQYSVAQMRSLPYLIRMARWRRLYNTNLASHGYGWDEIQRSILNLYKQKKWLNNEGLPDVWLLLKSFRKQSIERNEYIPTRRSHHSRNEISQQEIRAQAKQLAIQRQIMKEVGL